MTRSEGMVKNQTEQLNQFVFTLSEDNPPKQQIVSRTTAGAETTRTDIMPEWERNLERLRQNKRKQDGQPACHEETKIVKPSVVARQARRQEQGLNIPPKPMDSVADRTAYTTPSSRNNKPSQPNNEFLLDPVQRERAYRAYLQQWQQQSIREAEQQESALNDTALLIQEDWLAAQGCLQSAPVDETSSSSCTIQLKGNQSTVLPTEKSQKDVADDGQTDTAENGQPVIHVHMHVIEPRGMANKAVTCISEQALLQQLSEKLRPHLADVLSGMVRVAVQKHTAGLVSTLQRELLAEVPVAVEDILKHNLAQVMNNFKKRHR
ncbi:hypothetical protein [Snodgrassella communis]|uniref:hypothetical protein n=1 Tax=Snodgrassella communis TaxID=2946699 RepID=UPI001184D65B|nr:hypothetical protein [Snodgrassella communis]